MIQESYTCHLCRMQVSSSEDVCPFCDGIPPVHNKLTSKLQCKSCGFENDLANTLCVACEHQLYEQPKKTCDICGFKVKQSLFDEHSTNCLLSMEIVNKQKQMINQRKNICNFCGQSFPSDLMNDHYRVCQKIPKQDPNEPELDPAPYDPDSILEVGEMKRMTKLQNHSVLYMHKKSMGLHNKSMKDLQKKCQKVGMKNSDLQNLHFYIENYAPIIIHIHITRHMEFFIKDTHYRSQFQTGKSSGSLSRSSRTQWQDRMFDKNYSKASDFQRVKYGVINFTNDPKGVNCALGYGQSYLLLKSHVRARCTMTDKDSSAADAAIGTFKYCFHVLNKMSDKELKSAFNASKALEQSSNVTVTYKQIQIHGPVEFSKDIERLYVNKNEVKDKKFLDMVYKFHDLHGVDYEFI